MARGSTGDRDQAKGRGGPPRNTPAVAGPAVGESRPRDLESRLDALRSVFDGSDDVVYVADPQTHELLYVNGGFQRTWGEDVPGRKCYRVVHQRDAPCPFCTNDRIFGESSDRSWVWEFRSERTGRWYRCRDRAIDWTDGRRVRFEQATDVTDLKRTEQAARDAADRYRTLAEAAQDLIFMVSVDGRLTYVNAATAAAMQRSPDDLVGRQLQELFPPETQRVQAERIGRVLATGEATNGTDRIALPGGERWLDTTIVPLRDGGAEITSVMGIARDVTERKQADEALHRARESLEEAQRVGRLGSWDWDPVQDVITGSDEFFRLFDTDPAGMARFADFTASLHPDDVPRVQRDVADALAQRRPYDTDYRVRLRAGGWRDIAARGQTFVDAEGRPTRMVGTCLDVTDRKRAEQALRESEALYRTLVENLPQKIFLKDTKSNWVSVNERFARDLGVPATEVAGKTDYDFFPKELADKYRADDARIIQTGRTEEMEERYVEDGRLRFVHTVKTPVRAKDGRVGGVLGIFWDVTERRLAEETLQRHTAELAVRNAIAQVFLTVSDEEMYAKVLQIVLEAMQSEFGVFGYIDERGDLVVPTMTRTIWDKCQVPDKRIVFPRATWGDSSWPRAIREQRSNFSNLPSRGIPQGHIAITRHVSVPLRHRGEVVGLLQVANRRTDYREDDVRLLQTMADAIAPVLAARLERERRDAALKRALVELERSNRDLEQFAYVASHDLQEPLRMVASFVQLLARRYQGKLDKDADEFIGFAVDGAGRMRRLIDDLLGYSRVGTRGRPSEPVRVREAWDEAQANLALALEEAHAEVTAGELPTVLADRTQFVQLLQNLLENAIRFRGEEPPRVHLSALRRADDLWELALRDNGIGIAPEFFDRIFVIFQRLGKRDEHRGTGIGLAVCKKIVERHGGRIWVESAPGAGATFRFTMPAAKGADA